MHEVMTIKEQFGNEERKLLNAWMREDDGERAMMLLGKDTEGVCVCALGNRQDCEEVFVHDMGEKACIETSNPLTLLGEQDKHCFIMYTKGACAPSHRTCYCTNRCDGRKAKQRLN